MIRTTLTGFAALAVFLAWSSGAERDDATPDFDRDVAPLLARHCLDCHSGAAPKGDLDLSRRKSAANVITTGKPNDSTLWQRVDGDEMPPKKPLSGSEKTIIKRWIAAGAKWGADPIDPFRVSSDHRAGYDWWSLRPVSRAARPTAKDTSRARNAIDHFLLAKLEAKGLSPSPEADRRTLLRRVTFDLTGLPPTPDEVEAFLADDQPDAYERVVDRLLASPHHGERTARHWLDVVRFGESDGFERDLPRFNAWPYRDWVVAALNSDLPYDEFVRLQLAGDVLRPVDGLPATGFLVAGAHDIVVPVSENMKATMRQDELEDLVGTVGQTFLGLTVHCARCHDHKFDPIPQRDYYRLVAALGGVRHGERSWTSERTQIELATRKKDAEKMRRQISDIEEPARRNLLTEKRKGRAAGPEPLAAWDFTRSLDDTRGTLHAKLRGGAKRTMEGLVLDGNTAHVATSSLGVDLGEKTLEAWVKLDGIHQRGGGVMTVQSLDGKVFDAIVYAEQQHGQWLSGSDHFKRTRSFDGPVEKASRRIVHVAITYSRDGTITGYRDGVRHGVAYQVKESAAFRAGKAQVLFGLRHGAPGGNKMLTGTIVKARLYNRALTAVEVAQSFGIPTVRTAEVLARLDAKSREKHSQLTKELSSVTTGVEQLQREVARRIYATSSQPVGVTHVLVRGNVTTRGEPVTPGVLAALAGLLPDALPVEDEGQRRVQLARWVTDERNPLFARVMVNRLWQAHFGTGLVETPSDFGFNGGRPSHPELLDWLAAELVAQRWSLKAIRRLIVTSAAYRQSSRPRPEVLRLDAENRLLWRKSPQRLEAEGVRDAILAVTGALDRTMGGPPFLDFRTYFYKGTQFYDPLDQVGPEFSRRSLYRMWARGGRSPLLDTFDCPDPSATTPRRAVTTTPLQALALFNNAFVLDQAERLAQRLRREAGDDAEQQVRQAYRLAYGREPEKRELLLAIPFVERRGLEALGRVMFNTNEFVQVE